MISPLGTRPASITSAPAAKAMSVAMGIPQPCTASPPALKPRKTSAGTTMPPSAAITGRAAWRGSASSPTSSSRLSSRPTTKKKNAIRPSLIQWCRDISRRQLPMPMLTGSRTSCQYASARLLLARTRAATVAANSRRPPLVWLRMNSSKGLRTRSKARSQGAWRMPLPGPVAGCCPSSCCWSRIHLSRHALPRLSMLPASL